MSNTKPVIGITAQRSEHGGGMTQSAGEGYFKAVFKAGGLPLLVPTYGHLPKEEIAPATQQYLDLVHGLLLTGGPDIDPGRFGQEPHPLADKPDREREVAEFSLLEEAVRRDLPVLGICAGCQKLNVQYGGDLHQHVPDVFGDRINHRVKEPKNEPVHSVSVVEGSLLHDIYGAPEVRVNTSHHQGVDRLGDGLVACGRAEDGLVECIADPRRRFVLGVQWHPELLFDRYEEHLRPFRRLVEEAAKTAL